MKITIPTDTPCKIAKDDNKTAYRPHRTKTEVVGELRVRFGDMLIVNVGDWCIFVREDLVG